AHVRLDPDLQEMHAFRTRRIELAVDHTRAGAHALYVAMADRRFAARGILVRELAFQHVADDFHVAVTMRAEALTRRDAVLVDDAQRAELHVLRVEVVGERKGVERLEPAVIGEPALMTFANFLHGKSPWSAR